MWISLYKHNLSALPEPTWSVLTNDWCCWFVVRTVSSRASASGFFLDSVCANRAGNVVRSWGKAQIAVKTKTFCITSWVWSVVTKAVKVSKVRWNIQHHLQPVETTQYPVILFSSCLKLTANQKACVFASRLPLWSSYRKYWVCLSSIQKIPLLSHSSAVLCPSDTLCSGSPLIFILA